MSTFPSACQSYRLYLKPKTRLAYRFRKFLSLHQTSLPRLYHTALLLIKLNQRKLASTLTPPVGRHKAKHLWFYFLRVTIDIRRVVMSQGNVHLHENHSNPDKSLVTFSPAISWRLAALADSRPIVYFGILRLPTGSHATRYLWTRCAVHSTYCVPQQQVVVVVGGLNTAVMSQNWDEKPFFSFLRALLQSRNLHIIAGIKLVSTFLSPPVIVLNKPICPDEWWQPLDESQHLFHFCTSVKSPFFYFSDVLIQ